MAFQSKVLSKVVQVEFGNGSAHIRRDISYILQVSRSDHLAFWYEYLIKPSRCDSLIKGPFSIVSDRHPLQALNTLYPQRLSQTSACFSRWCDVGHLQSLSFFQNFSKMQLNSEKCCSLGIISLWLCLKIPIDPPFLFFFFLENSLWISLIQHFFHHLSSLQSALYRKSHSLAMQGAR